MYACMHLTKNSCRSQWWLNISSEEGGGTISLLCGLCRVTTESNFTPAHPENSSAGFLKQHIHLSLNMKYQICQRQFKRSICQIQNEQAMVSWCHRSMVTIVAAPRQGKKVEIIVLCRILLDAKDEHYMRQQTNKKYILFCRSYV